MYSSTATLWLLDQKNTAISISNRCNLRVSALKTELWAPTLNFFSYPELFFICPEIGLLDVTASGFPTMVCSNPSQFKSILDCQAP
jgi:hypothetical protein